MHTIESFADTTLPTLLRRGRKSQCGIITTGRAWQKHISGPVEASRCTMHTFAGNYTPSNTWLLTMGAAAIGQAGKNAGAFAAHRVNEERAAALSEEFEQALVRSGTCFDIVFVFAQQTEMEAVIDLIRAHAMQHRDMSIVLICEHETCHKHEARLQLLIDEGVLTSVIATSDGEGRYALYDLVSALYNI